MELFNGAKNMSDGRGTNWQLLLPSGRHCARGSDFNDSVLWLLVSCRKLHLIGLQNGSIVKSVYWQRAELLSCFSRHVAQSAGHNSAAQPSATVEHLHCDTAGHKSAAQPSATAEHLHCGTAGHNSAAEPSATAEHLHCDTAGHNSAAELRCALQTVFLNIQR